jgi:hemerythrin HHE cation binding domain-containing protein
MEFSIQSLAGEHREIEAALDCLAESVASGTIDMDAIRRIERLCIRHYEREEAFLVWLDARDAPLTAKLRGQHDEALELAGRLQEAVIAGQARDGTYLARRLLAIAQHNIIEEERDVFPLVVDA